MGCCDSKAPQRLPCPACGAEGEQVALRTLLHQLKQPWQQTPPSPPFYFCATPGCAVVYFDAAGNSLGSERLRQPVGQKQRDADATLCYCFDIRYGDAAEARQFVIDKTREGLCACDSCNPSGRCCLRDFPDGK